jgi:hypothetical protein
MTKPRWIPENSTEIKTDSGVLYTYERPSKPGKYCLVVYGGRRSKPDAHEAFLTEAERQAEIDNRTRYHAELAARRAKEKSAVNPFAVGDILASSWGYDQTNVDFYQVLKVTKKGVTIRAIGCDSVEGSEGFMQDSAVPVKGRFLANKEPMRKRVGFCFTCNDEEPRAYVMIESYAYAYKWDCKPQRRSWYA